MIGYKLKDIKGVFNLRLQFICPICKSTFEAPEKNLTKTKYGYMIKELSYDCNCGYSSNIMVSNVKNIPRNLELNRTCKECGKQWNFDVNDVVIAKAENIKTAGRALAGIAGNPIGLLPNAEIKDYNRCDTCGSRRVKILLRKQNQWKVNDDGQKTDNKQHSQQTQSRYPTSRRRK